jgi:hypothetical protein
VRQQPEPTELDSPQALVGQFHASLFSVPVSCPALIAVDGVSLPGGTGS